MNEAEHAAALNAILLPAFAERLARLGEVESGAYNFYATRIARGDLFGDYDLALARRIAESGLAPARIDEIGPGVGQLCFLLARRGFFARGIEGDGRRVAAGLALRGALAAAEPEAAARCDLVKGSFPLAEDGAPTKDAIALSTNLVFTTKPAAAAAIVAALGRYRAAIFDVDRLFESRRTPESRQAAFDLFAAAGHPAPEPFLDLGDSGRYHICRFA